MWTGAVGGLEGEGAGVGVPGSPGGMGAGVPGARGGRLRLPMGRTRPTAIEKGDAVGRGEGVMTG